MSSIMTKQIIDPRAYMFPQPIQIENVKLLKEWIPIYLNTYVVARRCAKSTYANYYSYMTTHILPVLGEIKLTDLTTSLIQQFIMDKLDRGRVDGKGGLSVKTVNEILLFLKQALRRACSLGEMLYNPCDSVYPPREEKQEVAYLQVEEQEQLEAIIESKFTENSPVFISLALASGMRIGEICALTQGDIDFVRKEICVNKTLGRIREIQEDTSSIYSVQIGKTKNKKQRIIPMNDDIVKSLENYVHTMPSSLKGVDKPLFCSRNDKAMEPCNMRYHLTKYLALANVKNVHFHTLRHTFATRCLEAGIAMKIVSKILGHSNISITMDLYTHVSLKTMHSEISKMNKRN